MRWLDFSSVCEQAGMSNPQVLARYLHATGFLFYQQNKLNNSLILDQNWMIDLVYRVFDKREAYYQEILRMDGVIPGSYTERIWPDAAEPEREWYLDFMCSAHIAFEIAYQTSKPFAQCEFVIPALLPETLNQYWPTAEWTAELVYPFLHRSIIERAIIALARLSAERQWWHNGIRFQDNEHYPDTGGCQVELDAAAPGADNNCLRISLHGGNAQTKAMTFARVLNTLKDIHRQRQPKLHWSVNGTDFVSQEALLEARNKHQTHVAACRGLVLEVAAFSDIPDHFDEKLQFPEQAIMTQAPKIFISYSHKDSGFKEELLTRLKNISRQFDIRSWHDGDLQAGEKIDPEIIKQLDAADIVCLLISPDFIASDYCFETEMQRAIENAEQHGNIVVVPIIVRDTPDWHQFEIGKRLALPKDGKPLEDWPSSDKFWASVQTGLKKLIAELQPK